MFATVYILIVNKIYHNYCSNYSYNKNKFFDSCSELIGMYK